MATATSEGNMAQTGEQQQNARLEWIQARRASAEARMARTRRSNTRVLYVSLFASTAATALAGFAAAAGAAPVASWRVTCAVVAVFTFVATVASGMQTQLDLPGNLSRLSACVGKLRALEYAAATGTRELAEIDAECQEIVREFPEFLG
jgi:hypothetical protein